MLVEAVIGSLVARSTFETTHLPVNVQKIFLEKKMGCMFLTQYVYQCNYRIARAINGEFTLNKNICRTIDSL